LHPITCEVATLNPTAIPRNAWPRPSHRRVTVRHRAARAPQRWSAHERAENAPPDPAPRRPDTRLLRCDGGQCSVVQCVARMFDAAPQRGKSYEGIAGGAAAVTNTIGQSSCIGRSALIPTTADAARFPECPWTIRRSRLLSLVWFLLCAMQK